jgi:inhibitor of KinA sporulation pathway (predicted exonuclease)
MRYDKVLIVDLEATCWEDRAESAKNTSEIIEIGVVLYNLKTKLIEKSDGLIVKPAFSTVSPFCTQLTTLTQEVVDQGMPLKVALDILRKRYDSSNYPWASWGAYDRKMIDRQCARFGLPNPMSDEHLNVKLLFALGHESHKRCGMEQALQAMDIPQTGIHHRGIDDALNITKILNKLLPQ